MPGNKENGIIPTELKELESTGNIKVEQLRVVSANQFGRPQVEIIGEKEFNNFREAIEWSSKSPEYSYSYNIPMIGTKISARLSGDRSGHDETLTLTYNERIGESPRSIDEHHGVSTDYDNFFNLIFKLGHHQTALFDRGVAWIKLSDDKTPPILSFNIHSGIHKEQELRDGIYQMLQRVNKILNDLSQGEKTLKTWGNLF